MPVHPKLACCPFFDSHSALLWPSCPCFWLMRGKESLFVGDPQTYLCSPAFILNPMSMLPVAHELYHCLAAKNTGCSKLSPLPFPTFSSSCISYPAERKPSPSSRSRRSLSLLCTHCLFLLSTLPPRGLMSTSCSAPLCQSPPPHHGMTAVS